MQPKRALFENTQDKSRRDFLCITPRFIWGCGMNFLSPQPRMGLNSGVRDMCGVAPPPDESGGYAQEIPSGFRER